MAGSIAYWSDRFAASANSAIVSVVQQAQRDARPLLAIHGPPSSGTPLMAASRTSGCSMTAGRLYDGCRRHVAALVRAVGWHRARHRTAWTVRNARLRPEVRTLGAKLKILYYSTAYSEVNGARTHARAFFRELTRNPRVSEARVFTMTDDGQPSTSSPKAARGFARSLYDKLPEAIRTDIMFTRVSPDAYAAVVEAIEAFRPDAFVVRLGSNGNMVGRLKRAFPGLRIIVEYNGSPFDEDWRGTFDSAFLRSAELRQLLQADGVGVVSDYLVDKLTAERPGLARTVFLNPNGVDPDLFQPPTETQRSRARARMGVPERALVVGWAGGMERWRRVPEIVSAIAEARRRGMNDVFLVLIGAGDALPEVMREVRLNADTLDGWFYASERWLEHDEVSQLMAAFDLGLLSYAHRHGSAQKLFEYLALGIPVLTPDMSIPPDLLSEDSGVFAFETAEQLIELVHRCREDLEGCRLRAGQGRSIVTSKYTWAANAERVVAAIERAQKDAPA